MIRTSLGLLLGLLLLAPGLLWGAGPCKGSTAALESMDWITLSVERADEPEPLELRVRAARNMGQRAAGMQHLCANVVRENPMLFIFPRAERPSFHMMNVHAPLDILFIREDGTVSEIHLMLPGSALTSPETRVRYALELPAGKAEALGLAVGHRVAIE